MQDRDPLEVYANTLVPTVIESTNRGERAFDIYVFIYAVVVLSKKL